MRARLLISMAMAFLIVASLGCISGKATDAPDKKAALAKCLTEKGVKMYGAYWCSHCKNQKDSFGSSFQYVNYVECDPQGSSSNPQACAAAGVKGYPTWVIDGAQYPGEQDLGTLATVSGCKY